MFHQLLSRLPANRPMEIHDTTIQPAVHVKTLGHHMDRYMLLYKHISEIANTVTGTLMYINRIKNYTDRDTRCIIVQFLVSSKISYCISIWG